MSDGVRSISRRRFLHGIGGTVSGLGLAACEYQSAASGPPSVATATIVPVPTQRPRLEPVEVELMIGSIPDRTSLAFQESMKVFHSYYPGIRIRLETPTWVDSQRNRLMIRFASGEGFDVAQFSGPHLEFASVGIFTNLQPFVSADKSFDTTAYYSRIVDYYSFPGDGIWCLPWSYATEALYFNKQHFADSGIAAPNVSWTWDDVRVAASRLTKNASGDGESGTWGVEFRLSSLDYVLRSFGGGFSLGEAEDPEEIRAANVAALQFVADLVLKDGVHPYPRLGLNDGFAQGKVSMSFLPEWATARLNMVEELDYDVVPIPQGLVGSVTSFDSGSVVMGPWCDYPDHIWEVMKWFAHADYGEWDVARALLFPEGIPTALIAANVYCWATYHVRPENRRLFLQSFETSMVPFSDSLWWPYLSQFSWFQNWSGWSPLRKVLEGRTLVAEAVKELEENWDSDRTGFAERFQQMNSIYNWGCLK